ncbi:MAG: hypothetical protein D6730_06160 [Bacteroidetes bacterium]|nr:MAG: hypothetical protein D6730_06160 [Bacteroidota bacterium]
MKTAISFYIQKFAHSKFARPIVSFFILLLLFITAMQAQKITLTPAMITNEQNKGDAGMLVDEQQLAGDPKAGQGGNPTTQWFTGWGPQNHPASAYINLGQSYHLYEVYVRDVNDKGLLTISYGSPGNWQELTSYNCSKYLKWVKFNANVQTAYLRITLHEQGANISEIVLYGVADGQPSQPNDPPTGPVDNPDGFTGERILISPAMVKSENGLGDPALLADEQQIAGDPAEGQGGTPSNTWFPGWGPRNHPAIAYIDLGQPYDLSKIFLFDVQDVGTFKVWFGEPGNWVELFTHDCGKYKKWVGFPAVVQSRYVRLAMMEQGANIAEVVLYGLPANEDPANPADNTPPAPVVDLAAAAAGSNAINLSWTAPGDDGQSGTAERYLFRYSTAPIQAANFEQAQQLSPAPAPAVAGSPQSMTVSGLMPATTYYFALKTADEAGNISNISNLSLATTEADAGGPAGPPAGKITLNPAMMNSENGKGDPLKLIDEQQQAGDPANSTGGMPVTTWFPGWGSANHPATAYLDLGMMYDLNTVFLRDVNDIGLFEVYAGSPGNWQLLFTDPMTGYQVWNEHEVSARTRYVRFVMREQGANVAEVVLYGVPAEGGTPADSQPPAAITDLQSGQATANSIALSWTAPGDDGQNGTATSYDIRYSMAAITPANFSSATQLGQAPAPAAAGTSQSVVVSGLQPASTYFFAIKALDEVPNTSPISNIVTAFTSAAGGGGDAVPPSQITDLGAGFPTANSIRLHWTTTGDDASAGTAAAYELRYSTSMITSANFEQASLYAAVPQPLAAGNEQQMVVNGLAPNTTYYFALKAIDESQNASPMSNIASASTLEASAAPSGGFTMDQLIGINAFFDDPPEKYQVAGFIRSYEYLKWHAYDVQNVDPNIQLQNIEYGFNPSYAGGANLDAYYQEAKSLGITVVPSYQESFMWLVNNVKPDLVHKPARKNENSLDPWSYRDHAAAMYQMAARYGSTPVPDNTLQLRADNERLTGMDIIHYYENWNEHDRWWQGPNAHFSPEEYAAMTSADYDGHMNTMTYGNNVKFGLVNADPNAKMVMSGLAHLEYYKLEDMKRWFDENRTDPNYRKYPIDVINIHRYSNDAGQQHAIGNSGVSPEDDDLKGNLQALVLWVEQNMPEVSEVWITEFGYDTNPASPQHAPSFAGFSHQEVQAQWLVRSYLAIAASGVHRAAMYMLRDVADNGGGVFQTSGLVSSKQSGWQPKPSWYYVYTMKNRLTGMRYTGEIPSGNPNVWIYEFTHDTNGSKAYAVWCPTSNGTQVQNFSLPVNANSATLVRLVEGNINGEETPLQINSGSVRIDVSERPVFVITQ